MILIIVKQKLNLTLTCDFSFNHMRAIIVAHTHAKDQGQRSVSSKDNVETDTMETDGGDCIASRANVVGNYFIGCITSSSGMRFVAGVSSSWCFWQICNTSNISCFTDI